MEPKEVASQLSERPFCQNRRGRIARVFFPLPYDARRKMGTWKEETPPLEPDVSSFHVPIDSAQALREPTR